MKKENIYIFISLALTMIVPVPGRLAYGIIMVLGFNFAMVLSTLVRQLIVITKLESLQDFLMMLVTISFAIIYKQIVTFYCPLISLTCGIFLYMPFLSSFVIKNLFYNSITSLKVELKTNMLKSLDFSLFAILFFLLRDCVGYGTISLPAPNGIWQKVIAPDFKYSFLGTFFASIPGAVVILSFVIIFTVTLYRKTKFFSTVE